MQLRVFERTGMQLSVLGFGCGAVGGLMVRGDAGDQERTIARAIAAGVNYFDTAVLYGDGESEKNLGRVLQKLKPANAVVGTKVRLPPGETGRIADAVRTSLEGSLTRLRLDRVDILHLHNPITEKGGGSAPPALASWAFACWPAAHCQARPSVIRSRVRRPSRSVRR